MALTACFDIYCDAIASMETMIHAGRRAVDAVIQQIADYTAAEHESSGEAVATARACLMDSLGCGLLALKFPACTKLLGPTVPGAALPGGARVPGKAAETRGQINCPN